MTRNRATPGTDAANDLTAAYYRQRAGAGLIVSEASQISQQGQGYIWTPGLYSEAQVEGWRKVTRRGARRGRAHFRADLARRPHLAHFAAAERRRAGRALGDPRQDQDVHRDGASPTSPSRARCKLRRDRGIVDDYAHAAANAKRAGFDGVEIHAANGYLIDQFLRDGANKRTDSYGGAIENRARFALEVVDAILKVWPARASASASRRSAPPTTSPIPIRRRCSAISSQRSEQRRLAYIHVIEGATGGARDIAPFDYAALRTLVRAAPISPTTAIPASWRSRRWPRARADLVAFGRPFIANPDLVERLRLGRAAGELDRATLYGGGAKGYTDYPALADA